MAHINDSRLNQLRTGGKWNLFSGLDEPVLAHILAHSDTRRYGTNENIYRQGSPATALYQVVEGGVLMRTWSISGKELLYVRMEPGDCFGELGLIDGKPCYHDADAATATILRRVGKTDFEDLRHRFPAFEHALLQLLARRTRSIYATIDDAFLLDVPNRLARRLDDMFRQRQRDALEPVVTCSHEELSKMIGSSRQSVASILKDWEREGWLEQSYKSIRLTTPERLTDLIDP